MTGWAHERAVADAEWRMERDLAETVVCPEPKCVAPVGVTCRNFWSGAPLEGQPAHVKRIKAANAGREQ